MSCCNTQVINIETIREKTGMSANVEDRRLVPALEEAQMEVEKILGETLYEELETAIIADPTLATEADLLALVDKYLCPLLSWRSYQYAIAFMQAEPNRNGVNVKSEEGYTAADARQVGGIERRCREKADKYQERLILWLDNYGATTFPSYTTDTVTDTRISKTYRGGVITRRSRWQTPYGSERRDQYGKCCDEH